MAERSTRTVQMVDLYGQYQRIKREVDDGIQDVINQTAFIRGGAVKAFEEELATYLHGRHAIGVGNGTDALQIAMMALGVGPGDEVITTPFTFIATAEAARLLGATPVWVDIESDSYNIDASQIEAAITERTKAIVPVHLFGRAAEMDPIMEVARRRGVPVIEDNAQAIGAKYGDAFAGFIGEVGCLSFFPSKNLGAFGDGGAVLTNDDELAERIRMVANHGSRKKYHNEIVGVNSRLDTIQAAILRVKLRHLDEYIAARRRAADLYDQALSHLSGVSVPHRGAHGHVFHQYTIRVREGRETRDRLAAHLKQHGVPSAIYYPIPLHRLPVFDDASAHVPNAEQAADEVLSLPMHTELDESDTGYIADSIISFFGR